LNENPKGGRASAYTELGGLEGIRMEEAPGPLSEEKGVLERRAD